jgi:hypothetical protein
MPSRLSEGSGNADEDLRVDGSSGQVAQGLILVHHFGELRDGFPGRMPFL